MSDKDIEQTNGQEPETPTRKLAKQSPVKKTTTFWSLKNDCAMFIESEMELDLAILYEFEDNVVSYSTQPFTTEYETLSGKKRKYTPDFMIKNKQGQTILIEVKPFRKTESEEFQIKEALLSRHYHELGYCFWVATEDEIYDANRDINLRHLYQWRRATEAPVDEVDELRKHFPAGETTLGDLTKKSAELGFEDNLPIMALAHSLVSTEEIYYYLTDNTPITL